VPTYTLPTSDNVSASAGFIGLLQWLNTVTFGWLSRLILIGLWLIVVSVYYKTKNDIGGGLAIAGFSTFVVTFLFWLGGFSGGYDVAFALGMMIVGVVWILVDKQGTA